MGVIATHYKLQMSNYRCHVTDVKLQMLIAGAAAERQRPKCSGSGRCVARSGRGPRAESERGAAAERSGADGDPEPRTSEGRPRSAAQRPRTRNAGRWRGAAAPAAAPHQRP